MDNANYNFRNMNVWVILRKFNKWILDPMTSHNTVRKSVIPNHILFFAIFTLYYKVLLIIIKISKHGKEKSSSGQ